MNCQCSCGGTLRWACCTAFTVDTTLYPTICRKSSGDACGGGTMQELVETQRVPLSTTCTSKVSSKERGCPIKFREQLEVATREKPLLNMYPAFKSGISAMTASLYQRGKQRTFLQCSLPRCSAWLTSGEHDLYFPRV
jgi:hypothetical protein